MTGKKAALIADDHELFAWALQALLLRDLDFEVVHVTSSFEGAAAKLAADPSIGLLCLDLSMPGMKGFDSVDALRAAGGPDLIVAIVTASTSREDAAESVRVGVQGFISKSMRTPEIAKALKAVLDGDAFVPPPQAMAAPSAPSTTPAAVQAPREPTEPAPLRRWPELSGRQRSVGELIIQGKSNKEIAYALDVAEGTVKVHVAALFRALEVRNRAEAVSVLLVMLQGDPGSKRHVLLS